MATRSRACPRLWRKADLQAIFLVIRGNRLGKSLGPTGNDTPRPPIRTDKLVYLLSLTWPASVQRKPTISYIRLWGLANLSTQGNTKPMPKSNTKKQMDEDDGWSVAMKSAVALLGGLVLAGIVFVGIALVFALSI
jgi:hypothetical protein